MKTKNLSILIIALLHLFSPQLSAQKKKQLQHKHPLQHMKNTWKQIKDRS